MTRHLHAVGGSEAAGKGACTATLGLGSNIGDKSGNIDRAIALLAQSGDIHIVAISRKYRSPPWGELNQDWFVNACVSVNTKLSPQELLACCQAVENDMGRVRLVKWGPRIIDVDILTYGDEKIQEPNLIVPHPLIAERPFVLLPLYDIAPGLVIGGRDIGSLVRGLSDTGVVELGKH